jgi:RNA polymerase sigma factor (sigma-70 family)
MEYERFAALVTPHSGVMLRVAVALVGVPDAEDAVQEALLRAWRGWLMLRDAESVRAWLLRITANVCANWQAGHFGTNQRRTVPLELAETSELTPPEGLPHSHYGTADDPFARSGPGTACHAAALDMRHAVAALDHDLRIVVALRFYAGMNSTEIGGMLDIPPATVRTRLRRALFTLRDGLARSSAPTPRTDDVPTAPMHERDR